MLHEEKAFSITCDGCGRDFRSMDGSNLFGEGEDMSNEMDRRGWEAFDEVATGKVLHFCRQCKGDKNSQA